MHTGICGLGMRLVCHTRICGLGTRLVCHTGICGLGTRLVCHTGICGLGTRLVCHMTMPKPPLPMVFGFYPNPGPLRGGGGGGEQGILPQAPSALSADLSEDGYNTSCTGGGGGLTATGCGPTPKTRAEDETVYSPGSPFLLKAQF